MCKKTKVYKCFFLSGELCMNYFWGCRERALSVNARFMQFSLSFPFTVLQYSNQLNAHGYRGHSWIHLFTGTTKIIPATIYFCIMHSWKRWNHISCTKRFCLRVPHRNGLTRIVWCSWGENFFLKQPFPIQEFCPPLKIWKKLVCLSLRLIPLNFLKQHPLMARLLIFFTIIYFST